MPETIIIGAGPAGLAVGACLRRHGRELVIVDRATEVGAAWRRHYERLHLHTARRHSALPYRPFPSDWPTYVPRAQVVEYLDDYARAFELAPHLGETVTRAHRTEGGWRVETSKDAYEGRNLVVATGYNAAPSRPALAGEDRFRGTIVHSVDYRNGEPYRDRRVLVVGAGNTGAEIALDLCERGAAAVDLCIRGPIHVVQRDVLGVPAQVIGILSAWIPVPILDVLFRGLVALTVGNLSRFGIRAPDEGIVHQVDRIGRVPLIDIGTVDMIKQGRIGVRPDVGELGASSVTFADGTTGEYDAIVLATGFRPRLDAFLAEASEVVDARGYPRRSGCESELPGLYFVGFCSPVTGMLREINREAQRVARAIAART